MASSTPHTVWLRGDADTNHTERAMATGAAIKPGMLVTVNSAGALIKHATGGGKASPMFAREASYMGGSIDRAFLDGEQVPYYTAKPGDWVYAWLAAGHDVAIGELLESDGAGAFRAIGTSGEAVVRALEAVDNNPGSGGAAVRIKVEVL